MPRRSVSHSTKDTSGNSVQAGIQSS